MAKNQLSEESRALVRSRIPNYVTLTDDEAKIAVIEVIIDDFYLFCERNLMIVNKDGELVVFKPNWPQRQLIDRVLKDLAEGRPVRYIILKARQMGLSTAIEALCYWWTSTHKNVRSVIMAHDKDAAKSLYQMFRTYYEFSDPMFRPIRRFNTREDLRFDVDDSVKEQYEKEGQTPPGLRSDIRIMVATDGKGRGSTTRFFHGSEVAKWAEGQAMVSGMMQSIPLRRNTFAFLESTAEGVGNYFHTEWKKAKAGKSAFKPLFLPWHADPEYLMPGTIENFDDEEKELLEIFEECGYPAETWIPKLVWRRMKKREFESEPEKFYQEYPKNDREAFLSSGRARFDQKVLEKMEKAAEKVEPKYVELLEDQYGVQSIKVYEKNPENDLDPTPFKLWHKPERNKKYVIGVDVSEGIEGTTDRKEGDYSVIDVMDPATNTTMARWRGHIEPSDLGDVVYDIGKYYNWALVGVEVNNHGLTTVQKLRDKYYRNLYMRETAPELQFQERTSLMGWQTTIKTKRLMIDALADSIKDGDIIDLDISFISECMSYVRDDQGRTNAQIGSFDDTVMAKAIAVQMAQWITVTGAGLKVYKPKRHDETDYNENTGSRNRNLGGGEDRPRAARTREEIRQQNRSRVR